MISVIGHRGQWTSPADKNSVAALQRCADTGFGTETDVRDSLGELVVSHDPPRGGEARLRDLVAIYAGSGFTLALNVKADGLSAELHDQLRGVTFDWFAFDMSGPETVRYLDAGIPVFVRQSDIESAPILYERADGVWLDAFAKRWYDESLVLKHLANGKRVCIVSPELHGRDHKPDWAWLRASSLAETEGVILCTDYPTEAREFFGATSD